MMESTALEIIEELDFTPAIPCEHSQHPEGVFGHAGPAFYFIKAEFPCGHDPGSDFFYICKGGYENSNPIECQHCYLRFRNTDVWTIISRVGS